MTINGKLSCDGWRLCDRYNKWRFGRGGTGGGQALAPGDPHFSFPLWRVHVTQEDVALQLGLPIDGSLVTGVSAIADSFALCHSLLGVSLGDDEENFLGLKFTWLKVRFEHLSTNATEVELMCAA
ncbi:hypothetical protein J1N35_001257 [Gossypium stocksii]|uniref:Aminotransferase-like plant mobile domain-containing protein n=1 Tax=Gossypium stocksii TaxID=47602 RepID=A0A9D3WIK0_9ROSI|nr:hypothetical protein J1N35_001257 [Gossypium stocksii]